MVADEHGKVAGAGLTASAQTRLPAVASGLSQVEIFDAHLHIIDKRFPLVASDGYLPESFTCEDYLARTSALAVTGGAIVSGSFQGFDQSYLLAALLQLGPTYVGVTQLAASVDDEEILRLDYAGVRAVRFNLQRGGSERADKIESLGRRVHELAGWHVELYVDSRHLVDLFSTLVKLPALSIDHLGLSSSGFRTLLDLVECGARVKASGFGRVDFDVASALKQICSVNPDALMFGTDLPSTRARRPFSERELALVRDALGDEMARRVVYDNAVAFYRPRQTAGITRRMW
jgi:predicted TIM-barrel fold metal-dependent hydrolase